MAYDGYSPYDFRAEMWEAVNASPLRTRRIAGEPFDADSIPDEEDA